MKQICNLYDFNVSTLYANILNLNYFSSLFSLMIYKSNSQIKLIYINQLSNIGIISKQCVYSLKTSPILLSCIANISFHNHI